MSKKSKAPARCVFCGAFGVTKQHVWADWMNDLTDELETGSAQNLIRSDFLPGGRVAIFAPQLRFPRGPFRTKKIRRMCGKCNGGWMSEIENNAKPYITKLVLGESLTLNQDTCTALAAWSCLFSIVAEYTDERTQAIPHSDCLHLMKFRTAPAGWHIWAASYVGEMWKRRYKHASICMRDLHTGITEWNTQFSTFAYGQMFIHAASSTRGLIDDQLTHEGAAVHRIWPFVGIDTLPVLSSSEPVRDVLAENISLQKYFELQRINTMNMQGRR
ncbi:hypothetical protein [Roseateles sp. P5_E7]